MGAVLQAALEQVPVLRQTAQLLDALEAGCGAQGQDDNRARLIMEQAYAPFLQRLYVEPSAGLQFIPSLSC
jgi:hypothetical protein